MVKPLVGPSVQARAASKGRPRARHRRAGAVCAWPHPQRCGRESTTYQPRADHLEYRIMLVGSNRREGQHPSQRGIPPAQQPGTVGRRSGPARRALAPARPTNAGISTLLAAIRTAGSPPKRPTWCMRARLPSERATRDRTAARRAWQAAARNRTHWRAATRATAASRRPARFQRGWRKYTRSALVMNKLPGHQLLG
jgi:hypothetical protein